MRGVRFILSFKTVKSFGQLTTLYPSVRVHHVEGHQDLNPASGDITDKLGSMIHIVKEQG